MDAETVAEYEIRVDFEKYSNQPSRIFHAMSGLIEAFADLDRALVTPFRFELEPVLLLNDVKTGSLRTKLVTVLRSTDDEAIKELDWKKLIGGYLLHAKYWMLRNLEGKKEIGSRDELLQITEGIDILAQQTDVLHLPAYRPVPPRVILFSIKRISQSLSFLKGQDRAEYTANSETIELNTDFEYKEEMEETLLTEVSKTHTSEAIIKVKKPDFLGESMWEFKHLGHQVRAKMADHNWLLAFQTNKFQIHPGDALRVLLETTTHFADQEIEIASHYKVIKVEEILRAQFLPSDEMFEE